MARILLAEDSLTQAAILTNLLKKEGYEVISVPNGRIGLAKLETEHFDLVLADMIMPELDGLGFVQSIRRLYPTLPAILMTDYGSEDYATEALQRGATGYIPKRQIEHYLLRTIQNMLGFVLADRTNQHLVQCWNCSCSEFILDCNPDLTPHVVAHLLDIMRLMDLCDDSNAIRISVALTEALDNALYHGNLELKSEWRNDNRWDNLVKQRLRESPYMQRKTFLSSQIGRNEARFIIRDEGPGFDVSNVPDPTKAENVEQLSGRGLLIIYTYMDSVHFNASGNEITLIKRRAVTQN